MKYKDSVNILNAVVEVLEVVKKRVWEIEEDESSLYAAPHSSLWGAANFIGVALSRIRSAVKLQGEADFEQHNHLEQHNKTVAMNYWIITVAEPYCGYILRGMKTMEIRRRIPKGLKLGDIIFIVRKGERGHIVGACRVTTILREPVSYFCNYHRVEHRLSATELKEYAGDAHLLFGICLEKVRLDTWSFYVQSLGSERAPQCFYLVRPEYQSTIDRVLK